MKIALGSDHGGYKLKEHLKQYLEELNIEYADFGCDNEQPVDYPDIGFKVSNEVKNGNFDKGILVCGTGIGMSIVANTRNAREHNDANILTLGERVIGIGLAREIVKVWLNTDFSKEKRHINRINKIKQKEKKIYK